MGQIFPCLSLHENSGSVVLDVQTHARFSSASMGQRLDTFCDVTKTDWILPGGAVLAVDHVNPETGITLLEMFCTIELCPGSYCDFPEPHHSPKGTAGHGPYACIKRVG